MPMVDVYASTDLFSADADRKLATGVVASLLAPDGTLVAYSAMSRSPMVLDPLAVIFSPITVTGFFMGPVEHTLRGGKVLLDVAER